MMSSRPLKNASTVKRIQQLHRQGVQPMCTNSDASRMSATNPHTMKIAILFSVVLASVASSLSASAVTVLDISGRKVLSGVDYYVLPVIRGRGGGLTLARTRNKTCPLDVVQECHEVSNGLPLTFSPVEPKQRTVQVSTDLNVKFSTATICVQSMVWRLDSFDKGTKQWFVTTGGVEGNPGGETIDNWFKIEKHGERDYKLVFCPSVCSFCKVICRDVGVFVGEDGRRRLALSDVPLIVMFKKARSD